MRSILVPALVPAVLALAVGVGGAASAQQMQCASRERVMAMLEDRLQQTVRARGLAGQAVMELFVNADTAEWTLTVTLRDGMTCLLANGDAFKPTDGLLPARGAPV